MDKTGILTDCYSGISKCEADQLNIEIIDMPFYVDGDCYDSESLMNHEELYAELRAGARVSTSQLSPGEITDKWTSMLTRYREILYIPLSSGLSSACANAKMLAQAAPFQGKVYVADVGRIATPMHRTILDAVRLIREGRSAAEALSVLERNRDRMGVFVTTGTLRYLVRGGRIHAFTATIGDTLHIKPILRLGCGKLEMTNRCKGERAVRRKMIEAVKKEIQERCPAEFERGEVKILAATSSIAERTEGWLRQIREAFPGHDILCDQLCAGVVCHLGYDALGVGYSWI